MNSTPQSQTWVYLPCAHCHQFLPKSQLEFVRTRGPISVPYCKIDYDEMNARAAQGKFISFNKGNKY
jgi:hypothetical protein